MKGLKFTSLATLLAILLPGSALALEPTISKQYTLVKKVQISRTEYDFTYKAELINGDASIKNVRATVSSSPPHTSVIDGGVAFSDAQAGERLTGLDTFTIRQNRSYPFDPASLTWSVLFDSAAPVQVTQALETLKQNVGSDIQVEWSRDGTEIDSITRPDWSVTQPPTATKVHSLSTPGELAGTPLENALAFLRNNYKLFQLRPDISDLQVESVDGQGISNYFISLQQTVNGVPVFDRGIGITVQPYDRDYTLRGVMRINNSYIPNLNIPTTPLLTEDEIIAIAQEDSLKNPVRRPNGITPTPPFFVTRPNLVLGIQALPNKPPVLVYQFTMNVTEGGFHTAYVIDANTGAVISAADPAVYDGYVTGKGRVFDPNPVNTLNNTNLKDTDSKGVENSGDAAPIDPVTGSPYFIMDLLEIRYSAAPKQYYLHGPYVIIDDRLQNPRLFGNPPFFGVARNTSTPDFKFTRENTSFEHVMAYYVVDTNQRYIQSLGLPKAINARPIKIDPHGYDDMDMSAYIPKPTGTGYLTFGRGGVDDAEDADIILHEYGHSIQDNQAPGLYTYRFACHDEAGAMGEGFGDYWAASNTYTISKTNGFSEGPECYGEWDHAGNPDKSKPRLDGSVDALCRRRVNGSKVYPKDFIQSYDYSTDGPCHENGEIWSSTLWELFTKLGKRTTDQLVLESHFQVKEVIKKHHKSYELNAPTFKDGGLALLQADEVLKDLHVFSTDHQADICATLKAKGILKNC